MDVIPSLKEMPVSFATLLCLKVTIQGAGTHSASASAVPPMPSLCSSTASAASASFPSTALFVFSDLCPELRLLAETWMA